jgi:hypothetical protein
MSGNLHPIFEAALWPFTRALHDPLPLSAQLSDAIDGAEETRGRDSRLQAWAVAARKLEVAQGERDAMAGALRDLILGAQIHIDTGLWDGAALAYIKAVKQVAENGLREGSVS